MAQQASKKPVFPPEIAPYIDVGAYLLDSRAPAATFYLDRMLEGKELILLTRMGQSDAKSTKRWERYFKVAGYPVIVIDSITGEGIPAVLDYLARLLRKKVALAARRGVQTATLRMAALGVPNVGKSTFLNTIIGERHFKVGDRPGITRGRQWVRLFEDVEVLDTPGILRDPLALNRRKPFWLLLNLMPYDFKLREQALDLLLPRLDSRTRAKLIKFYKGTAGTPLTDSDDLLKLAAKRGGFELEGDDSFDKAARRIIRDFQQGRFGRITLEDAGVALITSPLFRQPEAVDLPWEAESAAAAPAAEDEAAPE